MDVTALVLLASVAGYGDPDASGHPTWAERDIHAWTNAVRVEPEAFAAAYEIGGCAYDSFSPAERTPQALLHHSPALNAAAGAHSQDMHDSGQLSHDSSDGTSFFDRVTAYYGPYAIGENIAWNYPDTYSAVTQGWMCSNDHRENILSPDWTELGAGVVGVYYTQDFGAAPLAAPPPVAMGTHRPERPGGTVDFTVDWQDESPPQKLEVVLNGQGYPADLLYGTPVRGVYGATLPLDGAGSSGEAGQKECHEYYFSWIAADNTRGAFPEQGSYLFGDCAEPTLWVARQEGSGPLGSDDDDDYSSGGCSALVAAGAPVRVTTWALVVGMLALLVLVSRRD